MSLSYSSWDFRFIYATSFFRSETTSEYKNKISIGMLNLIRIHILNYSPGHLLIQLWNWWKLRKKKFLEVLIYADMWFESLALSLYSWIFGRLLILHFVGYYRGTTDVSSEYSPLKIKYWNYPLKNYSFIFWTSKYRKLWRDFGRNLITSIIYASPNKSSLIQKYQKWLLM